MKLQSPFEKYLDTGYVASRKETHEIHDFLADKLSLLSRLNDQITRLVEQRDALQVFVDRHKALVSPIHHIPAGVLSEIFFYCLPSDSLPIRRTDQAPLILTGICKRWREVAISTPRLWCRLHVFIPPRSRIPTLSYAEFLNVRADGIELWLNRSSPLPITLSVEMETDYDYMVECDDDMVSSSYEGLFLSFANADTVERWGNVRFVLAPIVAHELEDLIMDKELVESGVLVERLRTLSIELKPLVRPNATWWQWPENSESFAFDVPFTSFIMNRCPSLRSLSLVGWTKPDELGEYDIAWENLTHLELTQHERAHSEPFDPFHIISVLDKASSKLQSFILKGRSRPDVYDYNPNHTSITLPQLHTLHVHLKGSTATGRFKAIFNHIVAPSLLDLSVQSFALTVDYTSGVCSLARFLSRSACRLRQLDIRLNTAHYTRLSDKHITECLRTQPGLINLQVTSPVWWDCTGQTQTLVNRLTLGSPESLCPNLQAIKFTRCIDYDEAYVDALVALAHSRSSLPSQNAGDELHVVLSTTLRTFHALFPLKALGPAGWSCEKASFNELREAGIDFQLILPDEPSPADPPEIRERFVEEEEEDIHSL
ncbi:hypothetical protein PM082_013938 [Marasmius tenuissimus]|nr:hypothetical protein PM082_013938 [Marasmius tenuissimus]